MVAVPTVPVQFMKIYSPKAVLDCPEFWLLRRGEVLKTGILPRNTISVARRLKTLQALLQALLQLH